MYTQNYHPPKTQQYLNTPINKQGHIQKTHSKLYYQSGLFARLKLHYNRIDQMSQNPIKMSDQQLKQYIDRVFTKYDRERDGYLKTLQMANFLTQFFQMLGSNNINISPKQAQQAIKLMDQNKDNKITKTQLYLALKQLIWTKIEEYQEVKTFLLGQSSKNKSHHNDGMASIPNITNNTSNDNQNLINKNNFIQTAAYPGNNATKNNEFQNANQIPQNINSWNSFNNNHIKNNKNANYNYNNTQEHPKNANVYHQEQFNMYAQNGWQLPQSSNNPRQLGNASTQRQVTNPLQKPTNQPYFYGQQTGNHILQNIGKNNIPNNQQFSWQQIKSPVTLQPNYIGSSTMPPQLQNALSNALNQRFR